MSYWSHHPEELESVTIDSLPEPWKSMVENGEMEFEDVPEDILYEAMEEGVVGFWGDRIDEAMLREDD